MFIMFRCVKMCKIGYVITRFGKRGCGLWCKHYARMHVYMSYYVCVYSLCVF